MRQTEHYELNQWDPEDRILREDFNADNLKIAAALAGKLGKVELISFYASNIDSSGSHMVLLKEGDLWSNWSAVGFVYTYQHLDDLSDVEFRFTANSDELFRVKPGHVLGLLFPMRDGERPLQGIIGSGGDIVPFKQEDLLFKDVTRVGVFHAPASAMVRKALHFSFGIR